MSHSDDTGENLLITMSPSEIREEIARALYNRRSAVLRVLDLSGTRDIAFRIQSTDHTPEDETLDLIIGVTDDNKKVQVTIPTNGAPMLALRPLPPKE